MSQINKKSKEFVKTNSHVLEDTNNQEFGYWKSLKDISSEEDYKDFLSNLSITLIMVYLEETFYR